jgi:hypothetical protein
MDFLVKKFLSFLKNLEIHETKEEYRIILRGYPTISIILPMKN